MSATTLRMPIGESDFRLLVEGGYYFADKSLFIKEIIEDTRIILITRPRRFGKTLNLSMLRYYFAKEVDGKSTTGLFDGLAIQEAGEAICQHQNRYPVIFLTLKDLKQRSYAIVYEILQFLLMDLYREHHYLLDSSILLEQEKRDYQAILHREATEAQSQLALKQLSEYLYRYYHINPLILIDEYDTPIQSGYSNGYYAEIIAFFRGFLGAGLKDNPHCFKAVLTGILRISKESLFSGLNNIRVCSMLQRRYGEYFGFTETEVQTLLAQTGLVAKSEAIRAWYNGYQIGPHTIYNPWSLLNCVDNEGRLNLYWLNTSSNDLVQTCLYRSELIHKEVFEQLLQGQTITCVIHERIVFPDLKRASLISESIILSFLLMAGYFKVVSIQDENEDGIHCQLAIPNIEIRGLYKSLIKEWLVTDQQRLTINEFLSQLLSGDLVAFEDSFRFLLNHTLSVHDLSREPEAFYHGFMTGLTAHLQTHPDYLLKSNRESGEGRYDYLILSRHPDKPTILMEFKRVRLPKLLPAAQLNKVLEQAAQAALAQIDAKGYESEARQQGGQRIIKLALAFCGKRFKMCCIGMDSPIVC